MRRNVMNRIAIALVMLRDLFTKDEDSVCGVCGERLPKVFSKSPPLIIRCVYCGAANAREYVL